MSSICKYTERILVIREVNPRPLLDLPETLQYPHGEEREREERERERMGDRLRRLLRKVNLLKAISLPRMFGSNSTSI